MAPTMTVTVAPSAMTVTVTPMLMEETEPQQVDNEPHDSNPQDQLWVVDGLGLVESLQTLHSDGETQCNLELRRW